MKTRTKYASKDGIELAVFKAFREVLLEVLSFGLGVAELVLVRLLAVLLIDELFYVCLLAVLLVDGLSFVHNVIYDIYKQAHNQEKK